MNPVPLAAVQYCRTSHRVCNQIIRDENALWMSLFFNVVIDICYECALSSRQTALLFRWCTYINNYPFRRLYHLKRHFHWYCLFYFTTGKWLWRQFQRINDSSDAVLSTILPRYLVITTCTMYLITITLFLNNFHQFFLNRVSLAIFFLFDKCLVNDVQPYMFGFIFAPIYLDHHSTVHLSWCWELLAPRAGTLSLTLAKRSVFGVMKIKLGCQVSPTLFAPVMPSTYTGTMAVSKLHHKSSI